MEHQTVNIANMFDILKEAILEDRYVLKRKEAKVLDNYIAKFPTTQIEVTLFRISTEKSVFDTIIADLTGRRDYNYDSMSAQYCSVVHFIFTYFLSKRLEDLLACNRASLPITSAHTEYFNSFPNGLVSFKIKLDPVLHELSNSDNSLEDSHGIIIGPAYNINSSEDEPHHVLELIKLYRNILTAT